jgi:hypothetical protein
MSCNFPANINQTRGRFIGRFVLDEQINVGDTLFLFTVLGGSYEKKISCGDLGRW